MGNGQAVLLSKEDLESVWTDLVRLHKKQVRWHLEENIAVFGGVLVLQMLPHLLY